MPASGRHLGAGVSAPCVPQSLPSARRWRLDPPGGAPGRGSHRSPRPLSASPASRTKAELQIQWLGTNPSLAPTRGRSRRAPLPPGGRVTFEPLLPTSRRKPRAASRRSVTSKQGTRSAAGLRYRVGEGAPRLCPNFRRKATSPRARTDARTPTALGVQSPPPCCHQAPGPRQRLPPAAAEPSAACSPSRRPPRPAYPRAPRHALASYPLCDQPRPAADAGWLLKENLAGCPPGHPRPSISGGDPSRAGTVGREQRAQGPPLNCGGPSPQSRCSAGLARRARGRHRPRPTVTDCPPVHTRRAPSRCNAAILTSAAP